MKPIPNPGSDEAIEQGCICPQGDNSRGIGGMLPEGQFVIEADCPLHGISSVILATTRIFQIERAT